MADIWVVADHHFSHHNILEYAQRPWTSVDKMDDDLVKLHNSVVKKGDTVYFLGDVTLKTAERLAWLRRIVMKMNGTKHLIFGNHDRWHWEQYLEVGFQTCHTYLELSVEAKVPTTNYGVVGFTRQAKSLSLCHDPAWAQDKSKLWVCGHLHNIAFTAPSHIAIVSVELTGYKPVLLNDIVEGWRPDAGTIPPQERERRKQLNHSTEGGCP